MTINEWKESASAEAIEQYEKPVDWFKNNVKCCYNCSKWEQDHSLIFEYMYNPCEEIGCKDGNLRMTAFDAVCDKYEGFCTVENLLSYARIEREEE